MSHVRDLKALVETLCAQVDEMALQLAVLSEKVEALSGKDAGKPPRKGGGSASTKSKAINKEVNGG